MDVDKLRGVYNSSMVMLVVYLEQLFWGAVWKANPGIVKLLLSVLFNASLPPKCSSLWL